MIHSSFSKIRTLARDERGLSTVEYVVLLVLIVAMAVGAWSQFGKSVQGKLDQATGSFDSTVQAGDVGAVGTGPGAGGGTGGGAPAANAGHPVAE